MGMARQHVPYRNSMMTTVLRDSLGGNCRTVMVANITAEHAQLDESISTCRFAQRVAMVSNEARFPVMFCRQSSGCTVCAIQGVALCLGKYARLPRVNLPGGS